MDDSREQSPDWLRSFQAPGLLSISSSSESSPSNSPLREERDGHEGSVAQSVQKQDVVLVDSGDESPRDKVKEKPRAAKKGKQVKDHDLKEGTEDVYKGETADEEGSKKPILSNVSTMLPLVLPEKVQRSKALIECEGDSIDLSGDVGAVGRVVISKTASGNDEMLLDLKGTMYKSTIVPSTTFCVVSFGQTEAKIESIMTDYVQLKPHSNVFEAETMVEGTLEGFSFGSEDEGDNLPKIAARQNDQENENVDQANGKSSGKVEKKLGPARKKAKTAAKPAAKPSKRGGRKPQNTKKGKAAKK